MEQDVTNITQGDPRVGEVVRLRLDSLSPAERRLARVLLASLELEKLLYELRYEVGHRPDWVGIPARDLLREEA